MSVVEAKIIFIGLPPVLPVPRWSQKWGTLSPHIPGCAAHEGNHRRRTRHESQTLVVLHLRVQGLEQGDEHLPMLSCAAWLILPYLGV